MSDTLGFVRFNTGEISALMSGRIDTEEYGGACRILQNFIPSVQGPVSRRGGTRFVSAVKNSNKKAPSNLDSKEYFYSSLIRLRTVLGSLANKLLISAYSIRNRFDIYL